MALGRWIPTALAALGVACSGGDAARPKNIVLISIDTLRADRLGCYGHTPATSPAIDALAARGVLFEDCTAAAPWTLPAHASMLSGLFPSSHGVKDVIHSLTSPTLATLLAEQGYRTLAVVNSMLVGDPRYGLMRGFEPATTEVLPEIVTGADGKPTTTHAAGRAVELVERWLSEPDDRPFFLFAHFYDVHSDYSPDGPWRERFVGPYAGQHDGTTAKLMEFRASGAALADADRQHLLALYDAEIAELDSELAKLFAFLDERGLCDDTWIVLSADHGEEFGEHGGVLHGRTQYQELLHVPLVFAGPGVPSGVRVKEPAHHVDLAPTVLAGLGVTAPTRFDGIDLAPYWRGETHALGRELFAEADHNNVVDGAPKSDIKSMIRIGAAKLTWDSAVDKVELFDLSRDPRERDDLAARRQDGARALLERLKTFRSRSGGPHGVGGSGGPGALAPPDEATLDALRQLGYASER